MPEESPTRFTMVPARRSNEPTARKRARRILAMLFLSATLSVLAVIFSMAKGKNTTDLSGVNPHGRELAYAAAINYLTASYQNVPHATTFNPDDASKATDGLPYGQQPAPLPFQSLNWVGFSTEHFNAGKYGAEDFEVHHFLVTFGGSQAPTGTQQPTTKPRSRTKSSPTTSPSTSPSTSPTGSSPSTGPSQSPDGSSPSPTPTDSGTPSPGASPSSNGNQVQLDVPVLMTAQGPRLAAAPTFSVWKGASSSAVGRGDYTDFNNLLIQVDDSVKNQVATWAKAYVSGDSNGLLVVTGDQNRSHHYRGLIGFTLPSTGDAVQILSAIKADHGQLIVRARILLARAVPSGTVPNGNGTATQFQTYADFDLLVGAPGGAQPPILAWGPAGSAAELVPYSNATSS